MFGTLVLGNGKCEFNREGVVFEVDRRVPGISTFEGLVIESGVLNIKK